MKREIINQPGGTNSKAPYSPGLRWGNLLFVSGQTGSDPLTREFPDTIEAQTRIAMERLKAMAEAGGSSMDQALKLTVFMTDIHAEFSGMNAVYREYFPNELPTRSTVGVAALARQGLKVEIEMICGLSD
tara:strand:+ start:4341 stop:4730 length:390 start_codon:yes stop_codon:yes gene_type:complete